jgi:hypothetical protein
VKTVRFERAERQVKLTARILALNCRVADVKSFFSRKNFPEREIKPKWECWDKGFADYDDRPTRP